MKNLKILRENAQLMQKDLAPRLGLAPAQYSKYETDYCEPNISTLNAMADYFGVSVDYLLDRTSIPDPPSLRQENQSFIYFAGPKGLGTRIVVPESKAERLKMLILAAMPELISNED